jgi:hypothetical protein
MVETTTSSVVGCCTEAEEEEEEEEEEFRVRCRPWFLASWLIRSNRRWNPPDRFLISWQEL